MMYKHIKIRGEISNEYILRIADNACIPFDPDNSDAIEFCKWLKAGNVPEAADGETIPTQAEIDAIIAKLL